MPAAGRGVRGHGSGSGSAVVKGGFCSPGSLVAPSRPSTRPRASSRPMARSGTLVSLIIESGTMPAESSGLGMRRIITRESDRAAMLACLAAKGQYGEEGDHVSKCHELAEKYGVVLQRHQRHLVQLRGRGAPSRMIRSDRLVDPPRGHHAHVVKKMSRCFDLPRDWRLPVRAQAPRRRGA